MKRLFWLLVIINLGMTAYFNLGFLLPGKPEIRLSEINPDKIKLLSPAEIDALTYKHQPAATAPATEEPKPVATCFSWGVFTDPSLPKVQKALAKISLQATTQEQNTEHPKRYWVYRPPAKTATEAQRKASELKALGIRDMFVVQEDKWKNAISFGIFEDELLADKLVQELKAKGVKNIEKALRSNGKGQHNLLFNNLSDNGLAELNKLKPDFPTAELKEVSCK